MADKNILLRLRWIDRSDLPTNRTKYEEPASLSEHREQGTEQYGLIRQLLKHVITSPPLMMFEANAAGNHLGLN